MLQWCQALPQINFHLLLDRKTQKQIMLDGIPLSFLDMGSGTSVVARVENWLAVVKSYTAAWHELTLGHGLGRCL